ncbi:putative polysaccharide biosynthesis protein [Peribacillus sp. JNUCC 23]|uniref:putative polysaccharide biosynthesis protein n=1 Tax=Peribacillus sp. NPDC096379 TaxID=3364393 RepID=UPI00381BCABF
MSSKLLKGAFILTLGSVLSKVLGLLYVIPFDALMGVKGAGLYSHAYVPYTIFISMATAGMPLAVSKTVSKYNSLEEYAVSRKLYKSSLKLMLVTGVLAFIVMYALAPVYANFVSVGEKSFTADDITAVIRAVSFALIIVPFMSIIRGFFQGHQKMEPTAISQVVEQIVRIVFLLAGAYVVLKIMDGNLVTAVSVATFAAAIGAVGGLFVLLWYWKKEKPYLNDLLKQDKGTMDISLPHIYKEILISSIPFIFVSVAMPVFQFVDNLTFEKTLVSIGLSGDFAESAFGILNFNAQKLVVIPMTLATAFSMALLPSVTKAYVSDDDKAFRHQLDQAFQILLFLTIPAVIGMATLADPIYTAFFDHNPLGTSILATYAPTAILFALFSVSAAVLQGINQQKYSVLSLLVGLLIKLSINIPFIKMFESVGAVYATTLGYIAACALNLFFIHYFTGYRYKLVIKRTILMSVFTAIMGLVVWGVESLLGLFLDPEIKLQAIVIIIISAIFGGLVYAAFSLKSKLAHRLFGSRIDRLAQKLGVKAKV